MAPPSLAVVLQHVRRLRPFGPTGPADSDANLLDRFSRRQDRDAFALLVVRHGPLVLRVCRRILAREPDVEDAFQATFLILVRKARSIRRQPSLAGWLYTVAQRVAWSARAGAARRKAVEQSVADVAWAEEELASSRRNDDDPASAAQRRELAAIVEAEVGRLPAKVRLPLILCNLQGRTHAEAARRAGAAVGVGVSPP